MPEILPFRGYRYDLSRVDIQDVVAPPYDVISPQQQAQLYDKSPYNVVRLILGREEDRYASAAKYFLEWQDKGQLVRDKKPCFYALQQKFDGLNGKRITRKGFIALCRLEEFEKKIVLPHEKTLAKPREDRFQLFKATRANFSQIFSLYSDPEKRVDSSLNGATNKPPMVEVVFEDVENRIWMVEDEKSIAAMQRFLADKQVLIADGHHRYETALAYRDFMRSQNKKPSGREGYEYVMMFFTNLEDEGLVIYPTHRQVHSLTRFDAKQFLSRISEHFICREFKDRHTLVLALQSGSMKSFGLVLQGDPTFRLITLKPTALLAEIVRENGPREVRELDVTLLHSLILRDMLRISPEAQEQKLNLTYVKSIDEAIESTNSGKAQLAFLMNATKIEEVRAVAKAGFTMPQKSTYFYPKILSGLLINKLD
jgi:uncharacterized protein (DUF1015 family)